MKSNFFSPKGFAESAFKLASQFVQRKVYSEVNDCFGIVLIGSKGTDNPLNRGNVTIAKYLSVFYIYTIYRHCVL